MRRIGKYRVEAQNNPGTIALNMTLSGGVQAVLCQYAVYANDAGGEVPICLCGDAETAYWVAYALARADEVSESGTISTKAH